MIKNCWLRPISVRREIESFFDTISASVCAAYGDNPSMREEHLEGQLSLLINGSPLLQFQQRIAEERVRKNLIPIIIRVKMNHITSTEVSHGADIGLVARISIPGEMELTKSALIQSKKLYDDNGKFTAKSVYKEIFTKPRATVSSQWDRMIATTPASVYLLFGPDRLYVDKSTKDVGLRVVTAQVIKGMHSAKETRFTAQDAYQCGKSFGSWLVDDFLCCTLGDTRDDVVQKALGMDRGFPVRNVLEIDVQANPNFRISDVLR